MRRACTARDELRPYDTAFADLPTSETIFRGGCGTAPLTTQADFDRARLRMAGKDVSRAEWQAAVRARVAKLRINIMLDTPIMEHFKALAGERGYQTIINDTLRRVIETGHLESDLRRVLREELARDAESRTATG